ncbi:hypothetical protein QM012_001186 [Aureobasidium pullulans]|uniref:BTB domain-containing protein n=1 Tax=Aureobasidium pullulans TaxID=5580 RepID=A0ABR0TH26_AURPU
MDPLQDWLTDLMNAPDPQTNHLQAQLNQEDEGNATTMLSHNRGQVSQQPVSRAVTTMSKRPPGACFQSLVTIEVGSKQKKFMIHKDLLTFYSDYFRAAFNSSFREATEGKLSLLDVDVDVEIFDIFHKFLYTGCLVDGQGHNLRTGQLVRLWLFGDKFIIPCFQNIVIDAMIQRLNIRRALPTDYVKLVWANTMPSALGCCCFILSSRHEKYWSFEALVDLAKALYTGDFLEQTATGEYWTMPERDKCYYHVHVEGENCE